MHEPNQQEQRKTLKGSDALELWRNGADTWNKWIEQHPGTDISFNGVDFSPERNEEGNLSFAGYQFGDGNVYFSRAKFGNGGVDFRDAQFGKGTVSFFEATFGNGDVSFARASFKDGNLMFHSMTFGKGGINFSHAIFGNCTVDFSGATFGESSVIFFLTVFSDSRINFVGTEMSKGNIVFAKPAFDNSDLCFNHATVEQLTFEPDRIGRGNVLAEGLSVRRRAEFIFPPSAIELKSLNLHGSSFDGQLILQGNLSIIPDLRATRYSHQVDLSALKVILPRVWKFLSWPPSLSRVAAIPEDSSKLRRLKEIAETNKDHQAALRFSAEENRAKRWIETSWFGSILDATFSYCSDYGQSILRPFSALTALVVASIGIYKKLAATIDVEWWMDPGWGQSLLLSISNSLPFLPQSRDLRIGALKALYDANPGLWVDIIMIGQGALSFIFLFLIGLGLRNRFRL